MTDTPPPGALSEDEQREFEAHLDRALIAADYLWLDRMTRRTLEGVRHLRASLAEAREEIERLRGLLKDYGGHAPECRIDQGPYYNYNIGPCTCGWESSSRTLTPTPSPEDESDE